MQSVLDCEGLFWMSEEFLIWLGLAPSLLGSYSWIRACELVHDCRQDFRESFSLLIYLLFNVLTCSCSVQIPAFAVAAPACPSPLHLPAPVLLQSCPSSIVLGGFLDYYDIHPGSSSIVLVLLRTLVISLA